MPSAEQAYASMYCECGETAPMVLTPERHFARTVGATLYETPVTHQFNYHVVNADVPTWSIVALMPPEDRAAFSSPTGYQAAFTDDGPDSRPGVGPSHPKILTVVAGSSPARPVPVLAPEGLWLAVLQDELNPFTRWAEPDGEVHISDVQFRLRQGWYTNFDGLAAMPAGWQNVTLGDCGPPSFALDEYRPIAPDFGSYSLQTGITPVFHPDGQGRMYAQVRVTTWGASLSYHEVSLLLRMTLSPLGLVTGYAVLAYRDTGAPTGSIGVYRYGASIGVSLGSPLLGGDANLAAGDLLEARITDVEGTPTIVVLRNGHVILTRTDPSGEALHGSGVAGLGCASAGSILVGLKDFVWGSC